MDDTDQLLLLCFVLMPFGKKMAAAARVTNFDSLYAKARSMRCSPRLVN